MFVLELETSTVRTRKSNDLVNKDLIRTVILMRCFEPRRLAPMRAARVRSNCGPLSLTDMLFASKLSC